MNFQLRKNVRTAVLVAFISNSAIAYCASPELDINIPTQSLTSALNELAKQTGKQLLVKPELIQNKTAPAVKGKLSSEEALSNILKGSGLQSVIKDDAIIVQPKTESSQETLPEVAVNASTDTFNQNLSKSYAGGQVATGGSLGLLGNTKVMDAPFNITSYTSQLIEHQQSQSIADVLDNDPSVRNLKSRGNDYDGFFIRGFLVNNTDVGFGGLYGIAPAQRTTLEGIERVEVIKGPNALLTGINPGGSVGGAINLAPKRAGDIPLTRVTADLQTGGYSGGHIDIGRRFGNNNEFGIIYNGSYHNGDTAIDHNSQRINVSTVGLDYRTDDLRVSLDVGYQKMLTQGTKQHVVLNAGLKVPSAPDGKTNYGQPWAYVVTEETYGMSRIEYDFNQYLTAYATLGAKNYIFDSSAQNRYTLINNQGDLSVSGRAATVYGENNISGEAGARGIFETGSLKHKWNLGYASFNSEFYSNNSASNSLLDSNIYHPTYSPKPASISLPKTKSGELTNDSLALADVVSAFDERIQFTLAARRQNVKSDSYDAVTGNKVAGSGYDKSATTPAVGITLKPWENISVYGNYIQGLSPGEIVDTSYTNARQTLSPYKTKQYETGVKIDSGKLMTTVSVFQIEQPFAVADLITNTLTQGGEQRNRGLELSLFGEPIAGWRILGGAMYLNSKLTQTEGGIDQGNTATGQPRYKANLYTEYDISWMQGLTLSAGTIYTSTQYNDSANEQKLPGWGIFSAGARYTTPTFGKKVTFRAKVDNLFAKDYWLTTAFNRLNPGAPRTLFVSATVDY